ncbi:RHS repeat protein [Ramlibacter terrae]|uniref:RHS repeat protein n=1 Tax=Ramlibacter terrae TaxID=2732511 RepID=A0ABX6P2A3_9BURK|nr:RHS repeat protein [Ramlibacter terrae]
MRLPSSPGTTTGSPQGPTTLPTAGAGGRSCRRHDRDPVRRGRPCRCVHGLCGPCERCEGHRRRERRGLEGPGDTRQRRGPHGQVCLRRRGPPHLRSRPAGRGHRHPVRRHRQRAGAHAACAGHRLQRQIGKRHRGCDREVDWRPEAVLRVRRRRPTDGHHRCARHQGVVHARRRRPQAGLRQRGGRRWTYTYDGAGRLLTETSPGSTSPLWPTTVKRRSSN